MTTGTIFHGTRTPLTVWFAAAWYITSARNGVAAKTLHRLLGFGSYQTAWAMLHRFRAAMVRPDRNLFTGVVEINEMFIGGLKPGKRGRGAEGKSMVAVELLTPKGFGRCRLGIIPNTHAPTLRAFLLDCLKPGSVIVTDGLSFYPAAIGNTYQHQPHIVVGAGQPAHVSLPAVHRIANLLKRWLLGTHQGAVAADHLHAYIHAFVFRFNRRRSAFRGLLFRRLLEQAVHAAPVTCRSLVKNPLPKHTKPHAPGRHRTHPSTLARTLPVHPWLEHNR